VGPAALRKHCLGYAGASETFPFGPQTSVFKVEGKMFALSRLHAESLRVSVKCDPLLAEQLRRGYDAVLPGYHLDKRHWNTIVLEGSLPERLVKDMIEDSYDLVVSRLPKARRRALGWGREVGAPAAQPKRRPVESDSAQRGVREPRDELAIVEDVDDRHAVLDDGERKDRERQVPVECDGTGCAVDEGGQD
jgi:predicted DNA-binding protein (MmcQ/YjbR family)